MFINKKIITTSCILLLTGMFVSISYRSMSEKILIDNQTYRISDIKTFDNPIDQAYWRFYTGEMKELPEGAKRGYEVGYSVAWQKEFYHVADLIYEAIINEKDKQKLVDYVKQVQNMSSAKGEFLTLDFERSINHPEEEPSYGNWQYACIICNYARYIEEKL